MRIFLKRLDEKRHRLDIERDDGSRDGIDLETKSTLIHDLLHFAVETEAGLKDGFWGSLAAGRTFAQLGGDAEEGMRGASDELALIERIVGAMSGSVKGASATRMMEGFRNFALAQDAPLPAWLDEDFIARVQERMRQLLGHWNGTPFADKMSLEWLTT